MTAPVVLVDLGNTNIKLALATHKGAGEALVLPTRAYTADELGLQLVQACSFLGGVPERVAAWVVASVVPSLERVLTAAVRRFFGCPLFRVPADIPLAIENRYARPHEVGADRLVAAYAGRQLCTQHTLIVVDFGTATTFDCVQDRAYLGGLICPGVRSSVQALGTQTAKLPQIHLAAAGTQLEVGRDTVTSLNQGVIHGFAAMVEGLTARLKERLGDDTALVVATGGCARMIVPVCPAIDQVYPDLLMQGLRMAYERRGDVS